MIALIITAVNSSPFGAICPICRRHLAFGDVLGVTCFKTLSASFFRCARWILTCSTHALLAKTDRFYLVALLGNNNVGFRGMRRRPFGLVETTNASASKARILLSHLFLTLLCGLGSLLECLGSRCSLTAWFTHALIATSFDTFTFCVNVCV